MITLELLQDHSVFQATPTSRDLGALHVRFDDLTGIPSTEAALDGAIGRAEPVALVGHSGCGKSSSIAHVFGSATSGVAPITVPVSIESDMVMEPSRLVDHLLRTVQRAAASASVEVDIDAAAAVETASTTNKRMGRFRPGFKWLSGELAQEVSKQITLERSATFADRQEVLVAALETISDERLFPVLVFDDSDRWLGPNSSDLAAAFFGDTSRWMIEHLPCGIVVAVHPSYFAASPRSHVLQYFDTQIDIPVLAGPEAIEAILARRVEQYAEITAPDMNVILETGVTRALLEIYQDAGSLRRALQVCHGALHDAVAAGDAAITTGHIIAASNAG